MKQSFNVYDDDYKRERKDDVTFNERQKLNIWLSIVPNVFFVVCLIIRLSSGRFTEYSGVGMVFPKNLPVLEVIFWWLLILFFMNVNRFFTLTTIVNKEGIYVKLFPIHFKYKFFSWDDITSAYIRKYNPLIEFGGWGMKYNFGRWNWIRIPGKGPLGKCGAFTMSGNRGMQLEFADGKKLLIGTHRAEELEEALINLGKFSTSDRTEYKKKFWYN